MLEIFFKLDPTVQVSLIGAVSGIAVGVWAVVRAWFQPRDEAKEVTYGPKPTTFTMSDNDQARLDRAIVVIDNLVDTLERLRVEISIMKHK